MKIKCSNKDCKGIKNIKNNRYDGEYQFAEIIKRKTEYLVDGTGKRYAKIHSGSITEKIYICIRCMNIAGNKRN